MIKINTTDVAYLDIEVWRYDILVGVKIVEANKSYRYIFKWNSEAKELLDAIIASGCLVVTYNGDHYDLPLLYNYYFNSRNIATPFQLSKYIVEEQLELYVPPKFWYSCDLYAMIQNFVGLKVIEAIMGWEIRETTIDFMYEFKLTPKQRLEAEHYNIQDLDASEALYHKMGRYIQLRVRLTQFLEMPHEYGMPLPTMMGIGLKAHRKPHGEITIPDIVLNVPIKHEIKQIMLEQIKNVKNPFSAQFSMGGKDYTIANGGIHSELGCRDESNVFHVDVKGYYSLLMMNFDLFSRNIPKEGLEKYRKMYFDRLIYKKSDPVYADSLKLGLLSVWGATRNRHHILYDYHVGNLIPLYGELFLIWLIELYAENGIEVLNANTDGLIVKGDEVKIRSLAKMWQEYGNFDVETVKYARFVQKDVNSYIIGNDINDIKYKGRDFTAVKDDWLFTNIVLVPQTKVVSKLLGDILYHGEKDNFDPEAYVREHVRNFEPQDYMFIINHSSKYEGIAYLETGEKLQKVNRVYASKNGKTIYKYRGDLSTYVVESKADYSSRGNGELVPYRMAEEQFKYPGLPLVLEANKDTRTMVLSDLVDIDFEWYVDEIMRKYVTYHG